MSLVIAAAATALLAASAPEAKETYWPLFVGKL